MSLVILVLKARADFPGATEQMKIVYNNEPFNSETSCMILLPQLEDHITANILSPFLPSKDPHLWKSKKLVLFIIIREF